jgi:hypothetical protein
VTSSMPRFLATFLLLALSIAVYGAEKDEGISNTTPNERIPGKKYSSIRAIDFRNAPVMKLDVNDKRSFWPSLTDGGYYRKDKVAKSASHSGEEITLEAVNYLQAGNGRECALVRLRYTTWFGSSSSAGQVLVIDLDSDGFPIIRQRIEYNIRGGDPDEGWAHFNPANHRLVVSAVHGWEHCCNKGRIVITFKWSGDKFVPIGRKVLPLHHPQ